jgi:hypothetical protein
MSKKNGSFFSEPDTVGYFFLVVPRFLFSPRPRPMIKCATYILLIRSIHICLKENQLVIAIIQGTYHLCSIAKLSNV